MVSIYRLNCYRNPKAVGHVLDCVQYLTHETEKQQALGKHHYDDEEIKAILTLCAIGRKEEMRLRATGRNFLNETDSATVLYKGMTIRQVIEQINRLSKR